MKTLTYYKGKFASLRMKANRKGPSSPHKVALLLAVIDLMEQGQMTENKIWFDEQLKVAFKIQFRKLASKNDRCRPHNPFFHLRTEGFWHHRLKIGRDAAYEKISKVGGPGHIDSDILYAYLDDALYKYLRRSPARELLREALRQNLSNRMRDSIMETGNQCSLLECEALVADYFKMLHKEFAGKGLNSHAAIDSKHRNISAILAELNQPYIQSYKPAYKYPKQLKLVVLAHMARSLDELELRLANAADVDVAVPPKPMLRWDQVLDQDLPKKIGSAPQPEREFLARQPTFMFAEREQLNRRLGDMGEEFVLNYERFRMGQEQRPDLVDEIEWTSKEVGDGLGYDIRSFDTSNERELFIEVKTTNHDKHRPFFITKNEVRFSKEEKDRYKLYRVYHFLTFPRLFQLPGAVDRHVHLEPQNYEASFPRSPVDNRPKPS